MFKYILVISEEASGRVVKKKINPVETMLVVPSTKLKDANEFSNVLKGRSFSHLKINATLSQKEFKTLVESVAPILITV